MTVSAVSSLSLEPPMLLVCLNAASATQEAVRRSGRFAVNILAEHQGHIAERFARPGSDDKFEGLAARAGHTGVPLLAGVLATVECRIAEVVGGGTHRVFLAEAVHAEASEGSPLAYFRGKFGKFELGLDAEVYRRLRQSILNRRFGADEPLQVEPLAAQLSVSPSSVYYALTRLVGDKLVSRDPQRGHVVTPLDAATSDDAHDARLAIELGAAELVVGRLSAEQLAQMRELAAATGSQYATAGSATSRASSTPVMPSTVPRRRDRRPVPGGGLRAAQPARPDVAGAAERDRHRPAPRHRPLRPGRGAGAGRPAGGAPGAGGPQRAGEGDAAGRYRAPRRPALTPALPSFPAVSLR